MHTNPICQRVDRRCPGGNTRLIEGAGRFAAGSAYATANPNHLLNAPAGRMGAFADRPPDFLHWLQGLPRAGRAIGNGCAPLPLGYRLLVNPVAPGQRPQALLTMLYRSTDRLVCLSCPLKQDRRG